MTVTDTTLDLSHSGELAILAILYHKSWWIYQLFEIVVQAF